LAYFLVRMVKILSSDICSIFVKDQRGVHRFPLRLSNRRRDLVLPLLKFPAPLSCLRKWKRRKKRLENNWLDLTWDCVIQKAGEKTSNEHVGRQQDFHNLIQLRNVFKESQRFLQIH
jgi:hypothetical protein